MLKHDTLKATHIEEFLFNWETSMSTPDMHLSMIRDWLKAGSGLWHQDPFGVLETNLSMPGTRVPIILG